jgi:hypothetical protein
LTAFVLAAALAGLSAIDDVSPLPTLLRLAAHLAAAGTFVAMATGTGDLLLFVVCCWRSRGTRTCTTSWTADGLAGGMAVIGFGAYAWARSERAMRRSPPAARCSRRRRWRSCHSIFIRRACSWATSAQCRSAFSPAHWGARLARRRLATGSLLVFAPFVGDATLTLLRRLARREHGERTELPAPGAHGFRPSRHRMDTA